MKSALVVGGTGPSGPHLVAGLLDRGFEVEIFHTGRHEIDEMPDVRHRHGDPFSADDIASAFEGLNADVVIATYGRVRLIAEAAAGECRQFISVGGTPVYKGFVPPDVNHPRGLQALFREDAELVPPEGIEGALYGAGAVRRTEDAVFDLGKSGAFGASVFRYPSIYGPRNPHAWEWSSVKRILDGRTFMVVPDGGLAVHSRLSSWNAAESILLAVDHPGKAAGRAFNCADDDQFSRAQWHEMIIEHMGGQVEMVSVPGDIPSPGWGLVVFKYDCSPHVIPDTTSIRTLLGYVDAVPARQGLAKTVDWLVANQNDSVSWTVLDPFDYEAEDTFIEAWMNARDAIAESAERYVKLPAMPLPQTATGKGPEAST